MVDDLGATLLDLAHGDPDRPGDIGGVVIHDPLDQPILPPHALVLGIGVERPEQVVDLLAELGRQGAAGLVLRAPVPLTESVKAAAAAAGVALIGLSRGVPWGYLGEMLRSLLAEGDVVLTDTESLGGLPSGDLFAVANAVASLLDAPVTIEDRSSRVLAFSGRQDEADAARVQTILGRRVPDRYFRILTERGVFQELHRSDRPIYIEPVPGGQDDLSLSRVAIAVRAGDEVLGSIWAAVSSPLSEERGEALRESSKLVALHMLRARAGADMQGRLRADLVSSALEGGAAAGEAVERLGLAGRRLLVLGATLVGDRRRADADSTADAERERQRLSEAFALHLGTVHQRAASALIGGVTYGLLPVEEGQGDDEGRALRIAGDFIHRIGSRSRPAVAVAPVATTLAELGRSRATVDRILRVLRERGNGRQVARLGDIQVEALLLEMRDVTALRGEGPTGQLARLLERDREDNGSLVVTLRAWLDSFGVVGTAADSIFVHPNTFRYRLRRIAEVGGLDLGDPDTRFGLMLQLRILDAGRP